MDLTVLPEKLKLRTPCTGMIIGTTGSGKTSLVEEFIDEAANIFDPPVASILYCYGTKGKNDIPRLEKLKQKGVVLHEDVPTMELIDYMPKPCFLILDDLVTKVTEPYLKELYQMKGHHDNLAVFLVAQNMFEKHIRVARENSHYLFLLRARNSMRALRDLGSHLFPGIPRFFMDAYNQATSKLYHYLFVNMHPSARKLLSLRSDIFKGGAQTVYLPKDPRHLKDFIV